MLGEHRSRPAFHQSEKNPAYLQLLMMEQGLRARINEQAEVAAVMSDPRAKAVMDKVKRNQDLSPDEQQTMNKIALAKTGQVNEKYVGFKNLEKSIAKRGDVKDPGAVAAAIGRKKYGKEKFQKAAAAGKKLGESRLTESELQQAQVVMAAQDMVDQMQKMMEEISSMQFKDLPALADAIKNDMGVEQAQQFQNEAAAALTQVLAAVQAGKSQMEAAQGVLTGQAPSVPGAGELPSADVSGELDVDADLDLDANLPDEEDSDEEPGANLGRERR